MPGPVETNFFRRANMMDTKVGAGQKDSPRTSRAWASRR